jgi:hypothetical protein
MTNDQIPMTKKRGRKPLVIGHYTSPCRRGHFEIENFFWRRSQALHHDALSSPSDLKKAETSHICSSVNDFSGGRR